MIFVYFSGRRIGAIPSYNDTKQQTRMNRTCKLCCFAVGLCLSSLTTAVAAVSINSLRIVRESPELIEVLVSCANDGTKGDVFVSALVKSRDGLTRNPVPYMARVPSGNPVEVPLTIYGPPTTHGNVTEVVNVELIQAAATRNIVVQTRRIDYKHEWQIRKPQNPDSDQQLANPFQAAFEDNFAERDFAAIDMLYDRLGRDKVIDAHGQWAVGYFLPAMTRAFKGRLVESRTIVREWERGRPGSAAASIAESILMLELARDMGYTSRPGEAAWTNSRIFAKQMREAEKKLSSAKSIAGYTPLWYHLQLTAAHGAGRSDDVLERTFQEGIRRFPDYLGLYVERARHFRSPSGARGWDRVDAVAVLAASNTASLFGSGAYSLVYSETDSGRFDDSDSLSNGPNPWPRMRSAFKDLVGRYPDSNRYLNQYAMYACRANDREAFLDAWNRLGSRLDQGSWPRNYSPDLCRRRYLSRA